MLHMYTCMYVHTCTTHMYSNTCTNKLITAAALLLLFDFKYYMMQLQHVE